MQLKYEEHNYLLDLILSTAFSLNEIGAVPGGQLSTFWLPVQITSIPNLSASTGTPPKDATVSTANNAPYLEQSSPIPIHSIVLLERYFIKQWSESYIVCKL